jgi:hypothetical protein
VDSRNSVLSSFVSRGALPLCIAAALSSPAFAQAPLAMETPPAVAAEAAPAKPAPTPPPPPYSLPWQLRPVTAGNVIRSDTAIAFAENAKGEAAATTATTLLASYKVLPKLAALVRLAYVHFEPGEGLPKKTPIGNAFVNPLVGGLYQLDLVPGLKMGLFFGMTIPIGQGGNPTTDPDAAATASAAAAGVMGRASMDNALMAVNYLTFIPGVGIAYSAHGFTAQLEATVFQLFRVRNKDLMNAMGKQVDADTKRTNFTSGVHLGYFVIPQLSVGTEIRMQRWLSTPAAVDADGTKREQLSWAAGLRGHFKLPGNKWLRPGISYGMGVDDPMSAQKYKIVQVDVPFVF